jgi:3-methyladenine DNA glycosylase/8-oxoguanine DNA glycosylase
MTQWDHEQLDWCLYRDAQGRWCLNQDRVRVVLYETLMRVARWETPEKEFAQRARALEEQLDPALNRLTAVAPAFASDLRDPLLSLAPHIAELEAARSELWRPSR